MSDDKGRAGKTDDIAIVGMACRFPGANTPEAFWENLRDGISSIRPLSDEELLAAGATRAEIEKPDYVKACPVLDDIDKFDAAFFGFSPREASVMDPAHRIFLELAWEAVENAGYTALAEEGPVGVFAGAGAPLYMTENLHTNPDLMRSMGEFLVRHTGNDMNFLATRVSYEMDLRGPSMNVQTACSSALVSAHLACQSLLRGECEMALAGGATVLIPQVRGYEYRDGEILSPDGKCRPFDAKSAGTVFGSGAGVLVLKRLKDALDHGDTIHAVIKGSAVNNDGAMKVGYLAPGVEGQAAVVRSALADAGVPAESISYIETHGTGTLVGDPIEVEALIEAYRSQTDRRGFCGIGSVKSNIGHLGEAAAAAALIKAVMALKHRQLPPSLGFETPNPAIDFDNSPFYVNAALRPWEGEWALRCGITALGAGGTNCHMILEEAPPALPGEGEREQQLLVLSAKTKSALDAAAHRLADAIETDPSLDLADAAFTLAVGRRGMTHRRALAVRDHADAIAKLRDATGKASANGVADEGRVATVFMFPGGGAQYARMGLELYQTEPVYREAVDRCLQIVEPVLGRDLKALMYPPESEAEAATRTLEQPSLALPALFSTEYGMARLFESWGLAPKALIGHSLGEYVAACISGVMDLADALRLVMKRGQLFEVVEPGGMLSVPLSENELVGLAPPGLSIAAVNAPELCVASGPKAAIAALQKILLDRDVDSTPIHIDVAAHSSMLDPVLAEFRELCRTIRLQAPQIPFVSNVTGDWITPAQATDPDYWVKHLRSTVRFADGLKTIATLGDVALVEVGPGRTLSSLAKAQETPFKNSFNSMRHPNEAASDLAYALTSLGRLWCAGADVDWHGFFDGQLRNRVPLPTYPFEGRSFWVAPGARKAAGASDELIKKDDIGEWFSGVSLSQSPLIGDPSVDEARVWLLIADEAADARRLAAALAPEKVVVACAGRRLDTAKARTWRFDPDDKDQYGELLQAVQEKHGRIDHVAFIAPRLVGGDMRRQADIDRNFLRPTYLAQALAEMGRPPRLTVLTTGLSGLDGEALDPVRALALGPIFVAPREVGSLVARCVDLPAGALRSGDPAALMASLVEELRAKSPDRFVALSRSGRWTQDIRPLPLPEPAADAAAPWARENGVYLITGGLGGIGLEIAEHLARSGPVKLALVARTALPDEAEWDAILAQSPHSGVGQRIARVKALRALGAEAIVVNADLADAASLRVALAQVRRAFGPLNGVIHAAGVMDDEPLLAKTRDSMMRVLAPKVLGALALDALVTEKLDVFVVFSSVAALLGLPGQVDYTAANAFLDAFGRARSARAPGRTVVINWSAWSDIGMAASAYRAQTQGPEAMMPALHPALDGYADTPQGRVFSATFNADESWLVAEHKVKGGSRLLPGTAFVELMRAAFSEGRAPGPVELTNLTFVEPFQVSDGETRRLAIELRPAGDGVEIALRPGDRKSDFAIVTGEARGYAGPSPSPVDLLGIGARCRQRTWISLDGFLDQDFMAFGPRWANMRQVRYGATEALVELALPEAFASEVGAYGLHPAMLDMATGGAQALIPGADLAHDFYVPLGYERVRVFAAMTQQVISHVRLASDGSDGMARFDVTLADPQGRVFAEIEGFTMKRVDAASAVIASAKRRPGGDESGEQSALAAALREGIRADEGVKAFDRIMAQPRVVQALVSSVDVHTWMRKLEHAGGAEAGEGEDGAGGFQRPDLGVDYAAPAPGLETALAKIWSELLGVKQVGVHDDYFDLGGNSLVGVRMFARMRRELGAELPLSALLQAPTIRELAAMLGGGGEEAASEGVAYDANGGAPQASAPVPLRSKWTPLVRMSPGTPGKRPVFMVHGAKGNILWFKPLADRLRNGPPFYGVEAQGIDGTEPFLQTIEEMAQLYVKHIMTVDPIGPYRLIGYSAGGVIALEMADIIRKSGRSVEMLVMLDSLAPAEISIPLSLFDKFRMIPRMNPAYLMRYPFRRLKEIVRDWNLARAQRTLGEGKSRIEELSDLSEVAYYQAQARYRPQGYEADIILYRARWSSVVFERAGPLNGWEKIVNGSIEVVPLDAYHSSLFEQPSIEVVASEMRRRLDDLDEARPNLSQAL